MTKTLAWNVDTQYDFMRADGKLNVPDAESIEPTLRYVTNTFRKEGIKIVNTADSHYTNSAELSDKPDFVNTFPEHCMKGTPGADYVEATKPQNALYIDWDGLAPNLADVVNAKEIVMYKDAFDIFSGNQYADKVVEALSPERVFVYGVATNVCVDFAVRGLIERGAEVYVLEDAIKGLPGIPSPIETWKEMGAKMIQSTELTDYL